MDRSRVSVLWALGLALSFTATANAQFFRQRVSPPPFHVLQFGQAIAASADTVVVGAPDSVRNNDASNCSIAYVGFGAAFVYKKDAISNAWTLNQELWPPTFTDTTNWEPRFGSSVSLSGNVLVVGAERLNKDAMAGAGAFFLYTRTSPSATFSRFGPFYSPSASSGGRLGEYGGVATNGIYIAIADKGFVLFYRIVGNSASYVATIALPVPAPPEELLLTDQDVLVAFVAGYTSLAAYQLSSTGFTTINTSALVDGSTYTRPAAGDGRTFIAGLNDDPTQFRIVDFSGGVVTSVITKSVPLLPSLVNPKPSDVAIKHGAGAYVTYKESGGPGTSLAELLAPWYTVTSSTRPIPSTLSPGGGTRPTAFNGSQLFIGGYESSAAGGCAANYPSQGVVHSFLAGGPAKALVLSIVNPLR
jgi:hypothetical protein